MVGTSRLCLALGLAFLAWATLLGFVSTPIADWIAARVQQGIHQQVVWQPDSPESVAARYRGDNDPPLYANFHLFNITNVEAVRNGAKPVLQELGPYVFAKTRRKRGVRFVRGGASVRFHDYSYHQFVPEMSAGAMEDAVTTLNVPLIGALELIEARAGRRVKVLLQLLAGLVEGWSDRRVRGLFTTRSVGELLWGYEDPLLAQVARWAPGLGIDPMFRLVGNTSSPQEADAGFPTQVNTGLEDIRAVWQTERWSNVTEVTCWGEGHVERVRGTDAFQFRPGLALNDSVEVWVGELFRAARLLADEQVSMAGVPLLRLRADLTQGDPDPRFFQTIRGLMNITGPTASGPSGPPGAPGPPIFLSYPHFCGADPRLAEGVVGLRCKPEYHDLFLDVEPSTGVTLRAAKRLMMVSWFGGKWGSIDPAARDTFLPIFWAEESSEAEAEQMRQFAPLLRARAAEAALRRWGHPAALAVAMAAVAPLCVAAVLWAGDSAAGRDAEVEVEADGGPAGYERLEQGEGEQAGTGQQHTMPQQPLQRQPVSFPVAVDAEHEQDGQGG